MAKEKFGGKLKKAVMDFKKSVCCAIAVRLFAYTAISVFCCAFGRDKSYCFSFWKHPNVVIPIQRTANCFKSSEQVLCMLYLCCWRYKLWWCASFVTSWTIWTGRVS